MVEIVLVNPPSNCIDDDRLDPPLGLLYIAAVLRLNGFAVEIYDMTGCQSNEDMSCKIEQIPEANVYGFTVYCTNYIYVKYCINYLRSTRDAPFIILGGPNPTALPDFTLRDSGCDCVITGEGEDAMLAAIEALCRGESVSPIIKGYGRINVDTYPMPAWDLIDLNSYHRTLDGCKAISLISSRGCKFCCAHCSSIIMRTGTTGVRYRSTEMVVKEMRYLMNLGISRFRFNDDNFTGNPKLPELLSEIQKLNVKFRAFGRIEDLTDDTCRTLSESGCLHISLGLESLNPDNLKALGKLVQAGIERTNLENAKRHGITTRAYFIVGLPYDNDETIKKYFTIAKDLSFNEYAIFPLIPYPGTAIAKNPEKFGYQIANSDFTSYILIGRNRSTTFSLRHRNFDEKDVRRWLNYVDSLFSSSNKVHKDQSKVA